MCGSLINCTFTSALATLTVHGGTPATATANKVALLRNGGFCPSEATWDAEYTISQPNPIYGAGS